MGGTLLQASCQVREGVQDVGEPGARLRRNEGEYELNGEPVTMRGAGYAALSQGLTCAARGTCSRPTSISRNQPAI